jgi:3-oxoadipate CoA-transferase, beta subunit
MIGAARRLAADLPSGALVNLGRGLPTLVADVLPEDRGVVLQSENGLIGLARLASDADPDPTVTDASKRPVGLRPGAALMDLAASFDMIRSGRIDIAVLGAFEVSIAGDLANHVSNDPEFPPAVGGAMDLAAGARAVWVLMRHADKDGRPKMRERLDLPVTARGVVRRVYTDKATFWIEPEGVRQVWPVHGRRSGVDHE